MCAVVPCWAHAATKWHLINHIHTHTHIHTDTHKQNTSTQAQPTWVSALACM